LVWTGAENLAPTGIQSSDCPARSELLYCLHCSDPTASMYMREWIFSIGGFILTDDNRSIQRKPCSIATKSTASPTWTGLWLNLDCRSESLATNSIRLGTVSRFP